MVVSGQAQTSLWRLSLVCFGGYLVPGPGGTPDEIVVCLELDCVIHWKLTLGILQEGDLKGAGGGHLHVPKDELVGKKTSLAEERALAGIQEKKESWTFGRRGGQLRRTTRML